MEISFRILCDFPKLLVEARNEDFLQIYICFRYGAYIGKSEFFYETILQSTVHAFHSSLCLGRIRKDERYTELLHNSSELSHDIRSIGCGWIVHFVGCKFIEIDRVRFSEKRIFGIFFPEREYTFDSFVFRQFCLGDFAGGIIRCEKKTTGVQFPIRINTISSFEPSVVRSIELNHLSFCFFRLSPFPVYFSDRSFLTGFPEIPEGHLRTKCRNRAITLFENFLVIFFQLFKRECRSTSLISGISLDDLIHGLVESFFFWRRMIVGGLTTKSMYHSCDSFCPEGLFESLNLAYA